MLTIRDIQVATGGNLAAVHAIDLDEQIGSIATDHRVVQPGDLFVALPGEQSDGHRYIPGAIENGARAILLSQLPEEPAPPGVAFVQVPGTVDALGQLGAYWRAKMPARVVGITGSVGKTSTKEVLASVLSSAFVTHRSQKSHNNEIGLPLSLLALRPEVQVAVLEMGGAYAMGEIEYLCSLARPDIGVVTNVGYAHIGRMGTLERIAETKSELVRCLPSNGLAVLNRDDPHVRKMAEVAPCPVLWYGLDPDTEISADEIVSDGLKGICFRLRIGEAMYPNVKAPLLGRHSVHTVLAAAAVAHAEGIADEQIVAAIRSLEPGLRLMVAPGVNGSTILDDTYNANPTSTLAALNLLADIEGRKVAVLGDMAELGDFAEEGHRRVGMRAAEVCDALHAVGPLSRHTAEAALQAGMPMTSVHVYASADEAHAALRESLGQNDTVLLKGSRVMGLDKLAAALSVPVEERP